MKIRLCYFDYHRDVDIEEDVLKQGYVDVPWYNSFPRFAYEYDDSVPDAATIRFEYTGCITNGIPVFEYGG